jgi:hypothetical protein
MILIEKFLFRSGKHLRVLCRCYLMFLCDQPFLFRYLWYPINFTGTPILSHERDIPNDWI